MRSARNLVENLWEVHILSRGLDLFEHLSGEISLKRQIYFTTPFIILYGLVGIILTRIFAKIIYLSH
jgi:hypothetical protein